MCVCVCVCVRACTGRTEVMQPSARAAAPSPPPTASSLAAAAASWATTKSLERKSACAPAFSAPCVTDTRP